MPGSSPLFIHLREQFFSDLWATSSSTRARWRAESAFFNLSWASLRSEPFFSSSLQIRDNSSSLENFSSSFFRSWSNSPACYLLLSAQLADLSSQTSNGLVPCLQGDLLATHNSIGERHTLQKESSVISKATPGEWWHNHHTFTVDSFISLLFLLEKAFQTLSVHRESSLHSGWLYHHLSSETILN